MSLIPWRLKSSSGETPAASDQPLARLRDEMDALFDRFFRDPWSGISELSPGRFGGGLRTDLAESDDDITVRVELPGVDPKDLDVNVSGSTLTIRGEKRQEEETKRRDYHFVERRFGSFHRSVQLPASVDPAKVDARFDKGVLTISIGKRSDAKPKRIEVRPG